MKLPRINFGKLNIGSRLRIGFGVIIAFMVVLTVTGIWSLSAMNGKLEQITKVNNQKIDAAYNIRNATNVIDKSAMTIVVSNDPATTTSEKKKIDDARAIYKASIEKLEKLEKTAKGKEIIAALKDNFTIAQGANDKSLELAATGNMNQATSILSGSIKIAEMLVESCEEMVVYQQKITAEGAKGAHNAYTRALYVLLGMGAAVLVVAVFLASFLAHSITKPLSEGVQVAQTIAQGDLTAHIEANSNDETGQLLGAMKDMAEKLQHIIGEVKTAAGNVASASQQLNAGSELMSKGAKEQAARAQQVATASEEMSQTILDVAKNTSSIETSATDTAKLAKDGEVVVDRSVEKVKAIAKTIGESAELIKLLGERSNQIGAIISVINEIADQTNLLALNAAIEAARAGDAGRGFAVVADEVRKLAERTGNSTSEIGGMIKSIQDEVHRAVVSMENITTEVKSGVDLSSQAGDVLRGIVASVDQLHVMVQQIASASEEMAATSDEINRDIETIASVSRETSNSSDQVAQASNELAGLSVNLDKAVSGFRV
jgi:methyl-accepting chemotaxis protein